MAATRVALTVVDTYHGLIVQIDKTIAGYDEVCSLALYFCALPTDQAVPT